MPDYQCPNCNGGFPEPKPTESDPECPWCGEKLNGQKERTGLTVDDHPAITLTPEARKRISSVDASTTAQIKPSDVEIEVDS